MSSVPAPNPDAPQAPTRKPRIKLDTNMLLSDRGFRYLRTQALNIDFEGPCREVEDLDRLMLFYREWAHYLFPEARFSDFVAKVRKECSSRVMRQYLDDLRRNNQTAGLGGLTRGLEADFTEVNAGLNEALDILKKQDLGNTLPTSKANTKDEVPNFEDLDFGNEIGWSDEEDLLNQLEDANLN